MKRGHRYQVANALVSLFVDAELAGARELADDLRACRAHTLDSLREFHAKYDRTKAGAS